MAGMKRKTVSKTLLSICIVAIMGTAYTVYHRHSTSPATSAQNHPEDLKGKYLQLTGLSGTLHHGERAVRKFSIGALTIGPKKLSVFTVGRFYKLTIEKLSLELLSPVEDKGWLDLLDGIGLGGQDSKAAEKRKAPFLIVEAVVNKFELKISENGAAAYTVAAAKALFKPQDSVVKLLDVVIFDAQTNETLQCRVARLSKDGRLTIPGEYRLASPSSMQTRNGWVKQILKAG